MRYKKLLKMVAAEHNTTPKEADMEIRAAIKAAGCELKPEQFIELASVKINRVNKHNRQTNYD